MPFNTNPCRRSAFEAFGLSKQETDLRVIRRCITETKRAWRDSGGALIGRDGSRWDVSEAELNAMELEICDPMRRLRAEEFVHSSHTFAVEKVLVRLVESLEKDFFKKEEEEEMEQTLDSLSTAGAGLIIDLLPEPSLDAVDDLPWPSPPTPFPMELEPLEKTLMREA